MSSPTLAGFLTRSSSPLGDRPDGELVREYAATGSEAAFAELVRRYAPQVWGVCRRTVGHRQHAEDAFQAAFVVLARKAGSVRPPGAIGGWLHAVAVHTSLRARTLADRRRRRHRPLTSEPTAPMTPEPTDPDVLRALDEEIARLPVAQRAAVALCELGGVSRTEAATRLGIAEGTLSSQLAAARKTLAARLRGRGVALTAALAMLPATADAVPLITPTASDAVSSLADGAIRAMFLKKLKWTAAGAAAVLALAAFGSVLLAAPSDRERYQIKAPVPKDKNPGKLYLWCDDGFKVFTPDGKQLDTPPVVKTSNLQLWHGATVSPDGTWVAWDELVDFGPSGNGPRTKVYVRKLTDTGNGIDVAPKTNSHVVGWGENGTVFLAGLEEDGKGKPTGMMKVWAYAVEARKLTEVKLPDGHALRYMLPDGKVALTEKWTINGQTVERKVYRVTVAGGKATELYDEGKASFGGLLSPNGDRLIGTWYEFSKVEPFGDGGYVMKKPIVSETPVVLDTTTGKRTELKVKLDTTNTHTWAWSPDGTKVAMLTAKPKEAPPLTPLDKEKQKLAEALGKEAFDYTITIITVDGSKETEVMKVDGRRLRGFDWR